MARNAEESESAVASDITRFAEPGPVTAPLIPGTPALPGAIIDPGKPGEAMKALKTVPDVALPGTGTKIPVIAAVMMIAVLLVILVLAAQYESWSLPMVIVMIVPMGILSALFGVWLSSLPPFMQPGDLNIFTQVALVVLVGLACKNAILIVEFAKDLETRGEALLDAVLHACRMRLRPILMTSIAFCAGVLPLILGSGAGSEMRRAMGIAVFSGMVGVTLFGIFLTPVFYVLLRSRRGRLAKLAQHGGGGGPTPPTRVAGAANAGDHHV